MAMRKKSEQRLEREAAWRADWSFESATAAPDAEFDSMFTNEHGERWWCKTQRKPDGLCLAVWGDDVGGIAISKVGADVSTTPWIMQAEEQLWLLANTRRTKAVHDSLIKPITG